MNLSPAPETFYLDIVGTAQLGDDAILLLGPARHGFWQHFTASPEAQDAAPNPLDRWSKRVIATLADAWGGTAIFPSDGPPYPAFLDWAERTGRCWVSPVGLMMHDQAGLWLSFRGAVRLPGVKCEAQNTHNPCTTCTHKPCLTACPVDAMRAGEYDVAKCHAWLDAPEGGDCLSRGCAVRRACPVSQKYGRVEAQSEFHMKAFHTP